MRVSHRGRILALLAGVLAFAVVGCGGGGGGGPGNSAPSEYFIVVQEIPTNNQEVSSKLEDVNGYIDIEFSSQLDASTILDSANPFNGLSSNVNILNRDKIRVQGTPSVEGRHFRFLPPSGGLVNQQYTVTIGRNVESTSGKVLTRPFYTSFTVGPDAHRPVIRQQYPVANQPNVSRNIEIRITFNESLDPGSVSAQTVAVTESQTGANIAGSVSLQNNGFEIVFTPDPDTQLPPATTVVVTLQGGDGGISDVVNKLPFEGDPNNNNLYTFQFDTTDDGEPVNQVSTSALYVSTGRHFGVVDAANYLGGTPWPVGSSGAELRNESLVDIGSPGEIVLDPRVNGNGDTYAYVVDRNRSRVAVVNTLNSRIVGHIPATTARGVGVLSGLLFITEFGSDSLATINLTNASPGSNNWNDSQDPQTGSWWRFNTIQVGDGPYGVAQSPASNEQFVTNSLEGSCSILNSTFTGSVTETFQVGADPQDVAVSPVLTQQGDYFAMVSNRGAGAEDPGSISMWWNRGNRTTQHALITGVQNPLGINNLGWSFLVANSGGSTLSLVSINVIGGNIWATYGASISNTYSVGKSPQNCAIVGAAAFSSDLGDGILSVTNLNSPFDINPPIDVPGVKYVATFTNQ
jgi:hypothetical protein